MGCKKDYIVNVVDSLIRKCHTRDPFEIAEMLNINVWVRDIGSLKGFYSVFNRERYIIINQALPCEEMQVVCAHELGHDRLHPHFVKCSPFRDTMIYDMRQQPEREANIFGAALLISDDDILDNQEYTSEQIANILGVSHEYVQIKLELLNAPNQ